MTLIITDASLRNNMTIVAAHVYENSNVQKVKYYAINVTTTEAKLFAIRYRIKRALNCNSFNHIIIVTDAIYAVEKILDAFYHPFQLHSIAIS